MKWICFLIVVMGLSQGITAQIVVQKAKPIVITGHKKEKTRVNKQIVGMPQVLPEKLDTLKVTEYRGKILKDDIKRTGRIARIRGWVKRPVSKIWLKEGLFKQPVTISEDGFFEQVVVLHHGTNTIRLMRDGDEIDKLDIQAFDVPIAPLRLTLTWQGRGDVDIYLRLPNDSWIWYQRMRNRLGHLDVDNTVSNGPEHITLLEKIPGVYRVYVHYYKRAVNSAVSFRVDVFKDDRFDKSYTGVVSRASSSKNGPQNAGQGSSWVYCGDIHIP